MFSHQPQYSYSRHPCIGLVGRGTEVLHDAEILGFDTVIVQIFFIEDVINYSY